MSDITNVTVSKQGINYIIDAAATGSEDDSKITVSNGKTVKKPVIGDTYLLTAPGGLYQTNGRLENVTPPSRGESSSVYVFLNVE